MHILFCHSQFPAQFGFFADYAVRKLGFRCTFVCENASSWDHRVELVTYKKSFGATQHQSYYTRGFENAVGQYDAVYRALQQRPELKPDLIVAHAGLGGAFFLRELYDAKILNYFEYYYHLYGSDMDFRPEFPPAEDARLRLMVRNAPLLLELANCDAGYCPTDFQRQLFPREYQAKLRTVFDGIDLQIWRPREDAPRTWGGRQIARTTRIVTYCSRGFESMRGFDMFMRAAKIIYQRFPNVVFLIAGTDRICYGGDKRFIAPHQSFKDYVLAQDDYDASKFVFVGHLQIGSLAKMFSVADAHIYLTAPFVLSWSMLNALACGAVVVGSDTAPVREVLEDGATGLLADFFDAEAIAERTLQVLRDPAAYAPIKQRAIELVQRKYSTEANYPKLVELYEATARGSSAEA